MTKQARFFNRPRLVSFLRGLTLAVVQLFVEAGRGAAHARLHYLQPQQRHGEVHHRL